MRKNLCNKSRLTVTICQTLHLVVVINSTINKGDQIVKNRKNTLSLAIGTTALVGSLTATVIVAADTNPFAFNDLGNGYMVADKSKKDGSCGESKCGDNKPAKKAKKDGSCGESKCGDKKAEKVKKSKDGSCGESKCGDKKADKTI